MKATTFLAVALSAAVASAQLDAIPECALSCAITGLSSSGCAATDIKCVCEAQAFITGLIPCVQTACSAPGSFDAVIEAASQLCLQAGVTLSVPSVPTETGSTTTVPSSTATLTTTETSATETATETETETETTSVPTTSSTPTGGNTTDPSATEPPAPTGTDDSGAARNAIAFGGVALAMVAALL